MKRLEDREWWPELVALKDVFSLRELAERYGAAPAAIANALRRNKLDRAPAPSGPRQHRSSAWQNAAEEALHARSASPAQEAAPEAPPVAEPKPSPAVEPAPAPVTPVPVSMGTFLADLRGYRVVIDQHAFIVVAPDVAAAARVAAASGRGEVSSLELLGRALSV